MQSKLKEKLNQRTEEASATAATFNGRGRGSGRGGGSGRVGGGNCNLLGLSTNYQLNDLVDGHPGQNGLAWKGKCVPIIAGLHSACHTNLSLINVLFLSPQFAVLVFFLWY